MRFVIISYRINVLIVTVSRGEKKRSVSISTIQRFRSPRSCSIRERTESPRPAKKRKEKGRNGFILPSDFRIDKREDKEDFVLLERCPR